MNIRNFCIIAHIDHGKSTLADRFIELTGTMSKREMKHGQMLDTMELEQERGITIKLQPVRMTWKNFELNMIDTPGHVDFQYEVSRSLAACEGAILVVDCTQGIEAQTLSNLFQALDYNLKIIPVLNKIDLPQADPHRVAMEIEKMLGIPQNECLMASGKTGEGVEALLDAIIERLPEPKANKILTSDTLGAESKALVFDSAYDAYRGVISYVRVMKGEIIKGKKYRFLHSETEIEALEVGHFTPKYAPDPKITEGQIGYVVTGLKDVREARVGDTLWNFKSGDVYQTKAPETMQIIPLQGYKEVRSNVFAGLYSSEPSEYPMLRDALEKLSVSDSSLVFEPENSPALGHGYRCGFLGLLHMDIVQERLEREFEVDLVITSPSVRYRLIMQNGEEVELSTPSSIPDPSTYRSILEPIVKLEVVTPTEYLGSIMKLSQDKRGIYKSTEYIDEKRVVVFYEIPLAELITDFFDKLKGVSSGYASMSYEFLEFRADDLVKVDILIAGDKVDALSYVCHRTQSHDLGDKVCKKLKEVIPKELFQIAIQAAVGNQVVARETISAFRKDVTGYLYGGDYTRKMKLLNKQKKGKKRMRQMGKVTLPQEAFLSLLSQD